MLANGGWDLTLILLTWTIWRAPTNASKWRMGFNSAFKGLIKHCSMKMYGGTEVQLHNFFTLAVGEGELSATPLVPESP